MPMELVRIVPAFGASAALRPSGGAATARTPRTPTPAHTRTAELVRFMSPHPSGQLPCPEHEDEHQRGPGDHGCQAGPHSPDVDVVERPPQKQDRGAEEDWREPAGDGARGGAPC